MKKMCSRWLWLVAIVVGSGWLWVSVSSLFTHGAPRDGDSSTLAAPFAGFSGTASCSGRACHGGIGSTGAKGCEYTTWILNDPHTKAFAVLGNERSRAMVKNLRQLQTLEDAKPQADALCLSCHGPATLATGPKAGGDDGFGCESCHGASEKWLRPHTAPADWAKVSNADKRQLGFKPMDSWEDRVKVCTECHVGSGERDVNHDLYAAGHPRLNFEFDTYYANLPRHWQPERDKNRIEAWVTGQAVSAQAALELLAYRADPKHDKPWPEFAEYDCFACHHDLKAKSWRQERGYRGVPGSLPWNDWYYGLPALGLADDRLGLLSKLMARPLPDRHEVVKEAQAAAAALGALDLSAHANPNRSAVFAKLIPENRSLFPKVGDGVTVVNWDVAAQIALALQTEYFERVAADAKKRDPETEKALAELFRLLQFSKTGTFDSPVSFDGKAVVKQIEVVCKRLGE